MRPTPVLVRARLASLVGVAVVVIATSSGCSFQKFIANRMAPTLKEMAYSFRSEKSTQHAREAGPALISLLDGFLQASPENEELLMLSAEMHGAFAFAFIENEDQEWAAILYEKGLSRAFAAANRRVDDFFGRASEGGEALEAALAEADEDDVPALFWVGFNWGAWINLNRDDPEALADLPRVERLMERVRELDPTYFYGGPDLFFGFYYGGRTKLLGGEPERSKEAFENVIRINGDKPFLLAKVLYAQTYCVNNQDRDTFERLLEEVIDTPDDVLPEETLANKMAKVRAEDLLDEIDDLFEEPLPDDD